MPFDDCTREISSPGCCLCWLRDTYLVVYLCLCVCVCVSVAGRCQQVSAVRFGASRRPAFCCPCNSPKMIISVYQFRRSLGDHHRRRRANGSCRRRRRRLEPASTCIIAVFICLICMCLWLCAYGTGIPAEPGAWLNLAHKVGLCMHRELVLVSRSYLPAYFHQCSAWAGILCTLIALQLWNESCR